MTGRELSITHALDEEFATVLVDLQRTSGGKAAAQSGAFGEKLTSLSALLQKHVMVDEVHPVLQTMTNDVMGAIPIPHDGCDYDPEVLQQAVDDAVAKISVPAGGKSATADDVRLVIEQMAKDTVGRIPVPHDDHDYDPEVLQQVVSDAIAKIPVPANGKSVTADDMRPMIKQMVRDAVNHIPASRNGRDYDPEVLLRAANDAVGKLPIPADGKGITLNDVRPVLERMAMDAVSHIPVPRGGRDYDPEVLQKAALDAMSALPAPQDGYDTTVLEISPVIDEQKSFPRGVYATRQGGPWQAYERTHGIRG